VTRPRIVLLRGHQVNPWDLRPWEELSDRFDVVALVPGSNLYDTESLELRRISVRALSDVLPSGRLRNFAARIPVNRYRGLDEHLAGADIVHAAEIVPWWSLQAAARKRHGYRLVLTVWETIPFLEAYRNMVSRRYRRRILDSADLFLAATERAREALLLEGASAEHVLVASPGIDVERFGRRHDEVPGEHVILSVGRLVWEKGHQDVLRALGELRRRGSAARALIVGTGAEERRLRDYAHELGVADSVEFRQVPYDDMPALYAAASCLVLASLPTRSWEEQFGMVLAEAMAAGLPILASTCGAIPEVAGQTAEYFAPGDWPGLAALLAAGPLSRPPGTRVEQAAERIEHFSARAAAERLARAYEMVLARP
jgi:glycosyltransferase involved in cell wall biosynthesis